MVKKKKNCKLCKEQGTIGSTSLSLLCIVKLQDICLNGGCEVCLIVPLVCIFGTVNEVKH